MSAGARLPDGKSIFLCNDQNSIWRSPPNVLGGCFQGLCCHVAALGRDGARRNVSVFRIGSDNDRTANFRELGTFVDELNGWILGADRVVLQQRAYYGHGDASAHLKRNVLKLVFEDGAADHALIQNQRTSLASDLGNKIIAGISYRHDSQRWHLTRAPNAKAQILVVGVPCRGRQDGSNRFASSKDAHIGDPSRSRLVNAQVSVRKGPKECGVPNPIEVVFGPSLGEIAQHFNKCGRVPRRDFHQGISPMKSMAMGRVRRAPATHFFSASSVIGNGRRVQLQRLGD